MITHRWYSGVPESAELDQMLADAAEVDREAGFPQVTVAPPGSWQLVVRLAASAKPAAYLRLASSGEAHFVVAPRLRSRGIATLLVEQVGLDVCGPGGWAGTGVHSLRVWARGDHPAADRLARRFARYGVRRVRREWRLVSPCGAGVSVDADDARLVRHYRLRGYRHDRTDSRYGVS